MFFVSVDSKEFNVAVSPLEATLARGPGSVENKKLRGTGLRLKPDKTRYSSGSADSEGLNLRKTKTPARCWRYGLQSRLCLRDRVLERLVSVKEKSEEFAIG